MYTNIASTITNRNRFPQKLTIFRKLGNCNCAFSKSFEFKQIHLSKQAYVVRHVHNCYQTSEG